MSESRNNFNKNGETVEYLLKSRAQRELARWLSKKETIQCTNPIAYINAHNHLARFFAAPKSITPSRVPSLFEITFFKVKKLKETYEGFDKKITDKLNTDLQEKLQHHFVKLV